MFKVKVVVEMQIIEATDRHLLLTHQNMKFNPRVVLG
jgi:hypothetical protein